ncbi:MAG: hypothetical protein ACTSRK_05090 [Promethearchaeota archaeon]
MSTDTTQRRTHQERVEAIFSFIEEQNEVFPKSRLKEIGLNPRSAEMWLKLIEFIQNQPRIRLIETDHNLLVEKVEGKYQALMRKMSVDENIPFEQRMQYQQDYLKSLYTRERNRSTMKSASQKGGNYNLASNPRKIVVEIINAFEVLSILDPNFDKYIHILRNLDSTQSAEEYYNALSKWQKDVLINKDFQSNFKRILDKEFYVPKLGKITKNVPDFVVNLKRAEGTIKSYYEFLRENMADWFFT